MAAPKPALTEIEISRDRLAELLNEDLSREISGHHFVCCVLAGPEGRRVYGHCDQLEIHAKQELDHALTISRQIDYLGKMPAVTPKPARTSEKAKDICCALTSKMRTKLCGIIAIASASAKC